MWITIFGCGSIFNYGKNGKLLSKLRFCNIPKDFVIFMPSLGTV